MLKMTTPTLPFSGWTRAQVTDDLVEQARAMARRKGLRQFGFRVTKSDPYHTVIVTDGGTLDNPNGSREDNS